MSTGNMPCKHRIEPQDGIEVHVLRSAEVEVRIIPELGAKISSLKDRHSGRQWLWSPPGARLFRNTLADAFASSTLIGADECFPSIAGCTWRDRKLPDHGEAWSLPWTVTTTNDSVTTRLKCVAAPFVLERTARLAAHILRLDYTLTNVGTQPEEFLWALHPLMAIQPGDRIELPTSQITVEVALNCVLGERGAKLHWPRPQPGMDLGTMDFGERVPAALKAFARDLKECRADLVNERTRARLTMRFAGDGVDTLGIWINRGGWHGYDHVALEPTNAAADALDVAASVSGHCGKISPGQKLEWHVQLEMQSGVFPET
jgi:galactose mutarotase-like enzyme